MKHFSLLMQFLRDRNQFVDDIRQGIKLNKKIVSLLISSSLFFALYGAIMGSTGNYLQIISSAIKLPALYLFTMIICLPTLFFFDIINGSKRTFNQYLAVLLSAMAIISVMLFGFAPITLFFRLSINDNLFFKLLNVAILSLTGVFGISFFYQNILSVTKEDFANISYRDKILQSWLVLYGFVGSQLGWTLRPFFGGDIGESFQFFRQIESNFYVEVFKMIGQLFN